LIFVVTAVFLILRASHLELSGRAPAEFHPQTVARPMLAGLRAFG
jgi:hypothetical protein